jgi:hypothetical protein
MEKQHSHHTMTLILFHMLQLLGLVVLTQSFDYSLNPASSELRLALLDETTGISNIKTLFISEATNITVHGISWLPNDIVDSTKERSHALEWTTYVDGIPVDNGTLSLVGLRRQLPTQLSAGSFKVESRGIHNITVRFFVDESELFVTESFNAYNMWVSTLPLLVVLFLAIVTKMVRSNKEGPNSYPYNLKAAYLIIFAPKILYDTCGFGTGTTFKFKDRNIIDQFGFRRILYHFWDFN